MKSKKGIDAGTLLVTLGMFVIFGWLIVTNRITIRNQDEIEELQAAVYDVREDLDGLRTEQEAFREEYHREHEKLAAEVGQIGADQTEIRGNVSNIFYTLRKMTRQKAQEQQNEGREAQQDAEAKKTATSGAGEATQASTDGMRYLGTYTLTAYEWTGNPCANGCYPTEGYTVASNSIPLGTRLYIEGIGERVVEDTGGMSGNVIDIYLGSASACVQFGRQSADVYILD